MTWTKQQIDVLLDEYKKHPILYSVRDKYYHNRRLRAVAMAEILKQMRIVRPDINESDLLGKLRGLRSNYVHERKKQLTSLYNTTGSENIYVPSLWYYDKLSFLNEYITPRESKECWNGGKVDIKSKDVETDDPLLLQDVSSGFQSLSTDSLSENEAESESKCSFEYNYEDMAPPSKKRRETVETSVVKLNSSELTSDQDYSSDVEDNGWLKYLATLLGQIKDPQNKTKMCTISIPPKIILLFLFLLTSVRCQEEDIQILAELEMAALELQDDCENMASTFKSSIISSNGYSEKVQVLELHGHLVKSMSKNLQTFEDIPPQVTRNWTLLVKPGDAMLSRHDWSSLVTYDVGNDELMHTATVHCRNQTQNCVFIKSSYEHVLETSKNLTLMNKSWTAWQTLLSYRKNQFPNVLNLVNKAAMHNSQDDAKSYWEMLIEQEGAYDTADAFWEQIKPLYFKLQNFVKTRLFRYYNITSSGAEIPVYLLGSNFGYDWSHVADIVLPHPQIYHDAQVFLNKTPIQDIYKLAEEITQEMTLGSLGNKFWDNSLFNMTFCENHVISFCVQEHSELLACDKTSWVAYLDAFDTAIDVTLRNTDYLALPQSNLRYSVIDEAVKNLGSVLAIKNMRYKGVWDPKLFFTDSVPTENEMAELLLIALRVLPRLPFYLAADRWRLHMLEHGFKNMTARWWELRKEFQGVEGVFNNETDFLADAYITSNKPYLSKFLGVILQFQFWQYYRNDWQDPDESFALKVGRDENFLRMIRERPANDWPSLISTYYAMYELSTNALLDFFAPLNDYLDSAPLEQVSPTTTFKPTTTTSKPEKNNVTSVTTKRAKVVHNSSEVMEPEHSAHANIASLEEGPNPTMEKITMYIGISLLGVVIALIVFVVISKKMAAKRKRASNRRFER